MVVDTSNVQLWIDDLRPAPPYWHWCKSVYVAKAAIKLAAKEIKDADIYLDLDYDMGVYSFYGGDIIKLLEWLERTHLGNKCYFHVHSTNPIGKININQIIKRNKWKTF